jgi:hypothetical protein
LLREVDSIMLHRLRRTGLLTIAVTLLAVLALVQGVQAVPIAGTTALSFEVTLIGSTNVQLATAFSLTTAEVDDPRTGDFLTLGPPDGTPLTPTTLTPSALPFTLTGPGWGTGTFSILATDSIAVVNTRIIALIGTLADPGFAPAFGGLDPNSASIIFTFSQAGGPGGAVAGGATLATPSALEVVPEPTTLVLVVTGIAGILGVAYRRRRTESGSLSHPR